MPCSQELFAAGIEQSIGARDAVNSARSRRGLTPYDVTEFALLTVAAIWVFTQRGCDVVVLEVGMGGRWDPTTAVLPQVAAITGIDLDHTSVLGETREAIAHEKAGVIRQGVRCVLGFGTQGDEAVRAVFDARCCGVGVTPCIVDEKQVRACLPLLAGRPVWQAENIALARRICESYLNAALSLDAVLPLAQIQQAVVSCPLPGRFQCVSEDPLVIVDVSHNPQGIAAFLATVAERWPHKQHRPKLLLAVLADKDYRAMVGLLAPEFDEIVVTQTASDRALCAQELAREFERIGYTPYAVTRSVAHAMQVLDGESYIACGSVTLVGELMALLR